MSVTLLAAACVEPPPEPPTSVEAPLTGVDGAADQADRACHVVLRDLTRLGNGTGGYQTAGGSWIWEGDVELSEAAAAEGATAAVQYQYGSDPAWYQVAATPSAIAATPGFVRYHVRLDQGLPGPGMSGTSLSTARVQVMPLAHLAGGGRLFDHNRVPGDFDNYLLTADGNFAVTRNDAVCPAAGPTPPARIVFPAGQPVEQHGALVPGGMVRLEYDPARLTTCRNSRGSFDLWDITAHVRWNTGEESSASIKNGALLVSIPTTARAVEIWFENTAVPGCQAWDSNWGANYAFDLLLPPQWLGAATVRISRDTIDPCAGPDAAAGFDFGTWGRQRAAIANVCFQVWSPGVTDRDDPEVWRKLDATLRWRPRGTSEPLRSVYAALDRRVGNDARFTVDLRGLDPFRPYQCPSVPTAPTPDGMYVRAELEYVIVVNGVELRPAPGAYYPATFTNYLDPACP
ncbi:MAG: hypothetical protein IPL61_35495 [Myxococcales bacterium]|nr:hypothetical protein [Myxococcales bacterium]